MSTAHQLPLFGPPDPADVAAFREEVKQNTAAYDPREQDLVIRVFTDMLRAATADGGRKRARGEKPPWWRDDAHGPAIFSHLNKWQHGELHDADSGADPLVHLAWRALALAYRRQYGSRDPAEFWHE